MKNKIFKFVFILLFICYSGLFIAQQSGYYEKKLYEKRLMTEKQMLKFEEDVASNLPVDIIDYLPEEKSYANFYTKSANKIENYLADLCEGKIKNIWEFFKSLFIS